ncbi:MAG: hypothetical protein Q8N91_02720 [Candidatus Omnitrophota bacterium]|nr:hypothetical protein [Candidatus Omnitrophota bacterium]
MKFNSTNGLDGKLKYYMAQPTYNGVTTNGTLGNSVPGSGSDWPVVPTSDLTTYTSGASDRTNAPNGTFVGVSYGLNPQGLATGTTYGGTITYTIAGGL